MNQSHHPVGLPARLTGLDRTLVMGVLNVTPDSFSDGGRHDDHESAVRHGRRLMAQGADIVDVGGESTRPGAEPISATEEIDRILGTVRTLAADGLCLSVDTMHAETARAVIEAGALIVNDVSAGRADPEMVGTVAGLRTSRSRPPVFIASHWRGWLGPARPGAGAGTGADTDREYPAERGGVSGVVRDELNERVDALLEEGLEPRSLVIDPGLGFSKSGEQNWEILASLREWDLEQLPVLIGASRKRFVQTLAESAMDHPADLDLDAVTAALSTAVALEGAWGVRAHDAASSRAAVEVAARMRPRAAPRDTAEDAAVGPTDPAPPDDGAHDA